MKKLDFTFSEKIVSFYFDAEFAFLNELADKNNSVIITDVNIYRHHKEAFTGYRVIQIPAGEDHKNQSTADYIIGELITMEAGKGTLLIGAGGGMVTDISGFVAAIYMRGIKFALVPTSLLAMVDASIGGKNGIDVGVFKNILGTIRQPEFILYDHSFLQTLPMAEWVNGFAEIIKHACIKDPVIFAMLQRLNLHDFQSDKTLIAELVEKNVLIKTAVVLSDEFEKGERRLLNFGHTLGHAIENLHHLPHGHAISIGMAAACNLSEQLNGLNVGVAKKIISLLAQYHLPVDIKTDHEKVFEVLKMDKKREGEQVNFILLNSIGEAVIKPISLNLLYQKLKEII